MTHPLAEQVRGCTWPACGCIESMESGRECRALSQFAVPEGVKALDRCMEQEPTLLTTFGHEAPAPAALPELRYGVLTCPRPMHTNVNDQHVLKDDYDALRAYALAQRDALAAAEQLRRDGDLAINDNQWLREENAELMEANQQRLESLERAQKWAIEEKQRAEQAEQRVGELAEQLSDFLDGAQAVALTDATHRAEQAESRAAQLKEKLDAAEAALRDADALGVNGNKWHVKHAAALSAAKETK